MQMWSFNQIHLHIFNYFGTYSILIVRAITWRTVDVDRLRWFFFILISSFLTLYCYQFPFVTSFSNLVLCVLLSFHRLKFWLNSVPSDYGSIFCQSHFQHIYMWSSKAKIAKRRYILPIVHIIFNFFAYNNSCTYV